VLIYGSSELDKIGLEAAGTLMGGLRRRTRKDVKKRGNPARAKWKPSVLAFLERHQAHYHTLVDLYPLPSLSPPLYRACLPCSIDG